MIRKIRNSATTCSSGKTESGPIFKLRAPASNIILPFFVLSSLFFAPRVLHFTGKFSEIIRSIIVLTVLYTGGLTVLYKGGYFGQNVRFQKPFRDLVIIFYLFLFTASISLIVGIYRGFSTINIIGDFYKFIIPFFLIAYFYLFIDSLENYERILYLVYWVGVVGVLLVDVLYVSKILRINERLDTIYTLPFILVLGKYFSERSFINKMAYYFLLCSFLGF